MNAAEFAATLAGAQYPFRLTREQAATAKEHGLVVVYGASDDLMEFDGAIYDELGAYNGTTALVDAKGLMPERDQIESDDDAGLKDYFERAPGAMTIDALWCKEPGYSWTFRTDIPHATFEVVEDGEPYCRGIVFALADVGRADTAKRDAAIATARACALAHAGDHGYLPQTAEAAQAWMPHEWVIDAIQRGAA